MAKVENKKDFSELNIPVLGTEKTITNIRNGSDNHYGSKLQGSRVSFKSCKSKHKKHDKPKTHKVEHPLLCQSSIFEETPDQKKEVLNSENNTGYSIAQELVQKGRFRNLDGSIYFHNTVKWECLTPHRLNQIIFNYFRKTLSQKNTVKTMWEIQNIIKYYEEINIDEFSDNPNLQCFPNGTLEIDTMYFRKNRAEDLMSCSLNICYDNDKKEMPETKKFLKSIANGDNDIYKRLLQIIGYILSNDTSGKCFFVLLGVKHSGKSVFCNLLREFFPKNGTGSVGAISLQNFDDKYSIVKLANSKLNIAPDLEDCKLSEKAIGIIKAATGDDQISVQDKFQSVFFMKPQFKIILTSNHPIRIKKDYDAFVDRIVYVPFTRSIPKEEWDREILNKMIPELPALYNRSLKAYKELVKNNYKWAGDFDPYAAVNITEANPRAEISFNAFANSHLYENPQGFVSSENLKDAYKKFCKKNNFDGIKGDRISREFSAVFGIKPTKRNDKRGYAGISLK